MATVEDLRSWIGRDVVDIDDQKLGKFKDVYFDVESDDPVFIVIDPGRKDQDLLAPAWNAMVSPERVKVAYGSDVMGGAPTLAEEGDLDLDTEKDLFAHFRVAYVPSQTGTGRRLVRH